MRTLTKTNIGQRFLISVSLALLVLSSSFHVFADDEFPIRRVPRINKEFPVNTGDQLSPPMVKSPIHECAAAVHVDGFVPHAKVQVFASQTELIGEATPEFGFADIPLNRTLKLGEKITATQTVNGQTSQQSVQAVSVTSYPTVAGGFKKPVVSEEVYQCGVIATASELVESVRLHIFEDGNHIGQADATGNWQWVWTNPLNANRQVTVQQITCEDEPAKTIKSPLSNPVTVKPEPNPIPVPALDLGSLVIGNDAVTLHNLLTGGGVTVFDSGNPIGGGFATGSANWTPVNPPLTNTSSITASQKLCGAPSAESPPGTPSSNLRAPVVMAPICEGAQHVVIRDTVINANVVLRNNGTTIGYGGAVPGELILAVGGNVHLKVGDSVQALQYMGNTFSPASNVVNVTGQITMPDIEIQGGEPFFNAEAGEQQIDGPVFPRGRGPGPIFKLQTCCNKGVGVALFGPSNEKVADLPVTELYPGYFTAQWDWTSKSGWSVPQGIPVGAYTLEVKTNCNQETARKKFYVIFEPKEVAAPDRFSFNETGIWFHGVGGHDESSTYTLYPDDMRIFGEAIRLANGETEAYKASQKIMQWVVPWVGTSPCDTTSPLPTGRRWRYTICSAESDVIDLLNRSDHAAQCADSANLFASMLRSVGIPAHPVTADAAIEHGSATWGFDTWTEARLKGPNGELWYVAHPHENHPWTTRDQAGKWSVANKSFNDLVIMANDTWIFSEIGKTNVSFDYNTSCKEPDQNMKFQASWIDHLCEASPNGPAYWAQEHWACDGIGSSSSGLTGMVDIQPSDLSFGGEVHGTLHLSNVTNAIIAKDVTVEFVTDIPETKVFPEKVLNSIVSSVVLNPSEKRTVDFTFKVPPTLPAGHLVYVRARIADQFIDLQPVQIESSISAVLDIPMDIRFGTDIMIKATVKNVGGSSVQDINAMLALPPGLWLDGSNKFSAVVLSPNESQDFTWHAHAVAPLEAGVAVLSVDSANGGWVQLHVPIRIIGDTAQGQPPCVIFSTGGFDTKAPTEIVCTKEPKSVHVKVPTVFSACSSSPMTVKGTVTSLDGKTLATSIPVVGGNVTLPPGKHEITWIASDGVNNNTMRTAVNVNFDPTAPECASGIDHLIKSKTNSSLCMGVKHKVSEGANVQLYSCLATDVHKNWNIATSERSICQTGDDGAVYCIDFRAGAVDAIVMQQAAWKNNQRWLYDPQDQKFHGHDHSMCLDIESQSPNSQVKVTKCEDWKRFQVWEIQ